VATVIASYDGRHDREHVKLFSAESVRPPAWLAVPVNILKRRFPRLNGALWNAQYRLGIWKYLDTSLDSGSEILVLVDEYAPNPRILDLGCGTSANLPLTPGRYRHYHGVDISATAIRQAEALGRSHASFEVADIITYSTSQRYDAILLREVLYYFLPEQAAQLLIRLAGFLEPTGKIFIQVFESVDEVVRSSGLSVFYTRTETTADGAPGAALMVLGIDAQSSGSGALPS
jgi:trans-aconitate methyltransferase